MDTIKNINDSLHSFLKRFPKYEKVKYQSELYSLAALKDGSQYANGACGRNSLVNKLITNIGLEKLQQAINVKWENCQDFINSFKSKEEVDILFQDVAHNFSDKFSRGCMNVFRYYLIHHTRKSEALESPLTYKEKQVNLRDKRVQKRLYSLMLRLHNNALAFRLCLAFSEEYRYKQIEFEHWLNLISYKYRDITSSQKSLLETKDFLSKSNGILKSCIKFTLFLQCNNIFVYPKNWMNVPSSQGAGKGAYHLHRSVYDQDFQQYLNARYDIKQFHDALDYGLIHNPWDFIQAEWADYKKHDEKQSFKWGFIKDLDVKVQRFGLKRLSNGKKEG